MSETKRACATCAYATKEEFRTTPVPALRCHHSSKRATSTNELTEYGWWCEHWWPGGVPLPTPWADACIHGATGICMVCISEAIREGLQR